MEKRQQGFTLLEVMVTLIVPAVLGAITLPLYQRYVAKTQVTAALADITPGKIGAEARIAAGAPSTDVPGDIALPPLRTVAAISLCMSKPVRVGFRRWKAQSLAL